MRRLTQKVMNAVHLSTPSALCPACKISHLPSEAKIMPNMPLLGQYRHKHRSTLLWPGKALCTSTLKIIVLSLPHHLASSLTSFGMGQRRNSSCDPKKNLQAALAATRPNTTQSSNELPPKRLLP